MKERILFAWSGGKDSALALYELLQSQSVEISGLLTTVTAGYDRVSMHGVRRSLLEKQAESVGLPLDVVTISQQASNEEYENRMKELLLRHRARGVSSVAFGDIHLREVRDYRERHLARVGMKGIFPLWGKNTGVLARFFIEKGFRAIVTCVDGRILDRSFVGRIVNDDFLGALPSGIDPGGENGEYHSFVFEASMFKRSIPCEAGKVVVRDSFCFCDVVPTIGQLITANGVMSNAH